MLWVARVTTLHLVGAAWADVAEQAARPSRRQQASKNSRLLKKVQMRDGGPTFESSGGGRPTRDEGW